MTGTFNFDDARRAVRDGTAPEEAARDLVATLTRDERLWMLDGDMPAVAGLGFLAEGGYHKTPCRAAQIDRVGFPGIAFSDGPRGSALGNATCFPVSMARGATWDPELEEQVGRVIGAEMRAMGANFTGAVCVNLLRHPAWGRAQETYGEDPHHVGEMGAAFTRGLQEYVMACVKHYACNSMENARFSVDVEIDEVALHEVYLPHFRRIVDAGVASVMSAYNSVKGEWCGQNRYLLTDVLREEWGFSGITISDFVFGVRDAAESLRAGLDVEMPARMLRMQHLRDALENGVVTWDLVDRAAERIVSTLLRFDRVLSAPSPGLEVMGSRGHRDLARRVAVRSTVLLRNELVDGAPLLPLVPDPGRIAVIGHLADTVNTGDRGSSDVWDLDCRTVLDGLRGTFAGPIDHDDGTDSGRAAALAGRSDVSVVVVGFTYIDEGEYIGAGLPDLSIFPAADEPDVAARFAESIRDLPSTVTPERAIGPGAFAAGGDRRSLRLAPADVDLIRAVARANPRTVVVIQGGSAPIVSEWVGDVPAVVLSWYGGCEAGPALAAVLSGAEEPGGRLPFSIPVDEGDLPPFDIDATTARYDRWHGWWHLARQDTPAAFPFGFGLSYSTLSVHDVTVVSDPNGRIMVRGRIRNSGDRSGGEVIQVYADLPDPDAPSRLVGFARVDVPAHSTSGFELPVPTDRLATRDPVAHAWKPPAGSYVVRVGRHADDGDAVAIGIEL